MNFRRECVDCIEDAVETGGIQKGAECFIFQKFVADVEFQIRIDDEKPFRHRFRFEASGSQSGCDDLPVAVGLFHNVAVDDREFADGGTGEQLGSNSADAAESDAEDVRMFDFEQSLFAKKKLRPALPVRIHLPKTLR